MSTRLAGRDLLLFVDLERERSRSRRKDCERRLLATEDGVCVSDLRGRGDGDGEGDGPWLLRGVASVEVGSSNVLAVVMGSGVSSMLRDEGGGGSSI